MPDLSLVAFEYRAAILVLALALDWVFGEPDWIWRHIPHPVVIFGKAKSLNKIINKQNGIDIISSYKRASNILDSELEKHNI
jgi:cobalamin biosynthesis protein CobD/CbiB